MYYNSLSRLYPNLNISKVMQQGKIPTLQINQPQIQPQPTPQQKVVQPAKPTPSASVASLPTPSASVASLPEIKPEAEVKQEVKPEASVASLPEAKVEAKVEAKPIKGAKMPTKGQRGIQKTITDEEQKKLYLDKLSKMSVKRADSELSKIEKVLEEHQHDKKSMKTKEVVLKKQLKLINEAMLFGREATDAEGVGKEQPEVVEVEAEEEIKE